MVLALQEFLYLSRYVAIPHFAQKIFWRIGLSPAGRKDFDDTLEDELQNTTEIIEEIADEAKRILLKNSEIDFSY
jgi:POT family proton-dependent oligopeptide transporter